MKKIKVRELIITCYACPTQYDIYDENGYYYYFRYRHGGWYLRQERKGKQKYIASGETGDPYGGIASVEEVVKWLKKQGIKLDLSDAVFKTENGVLLRKY